VIVKTIEIRDRGTFIPAIAISTAPANEGQRYLLRRAGYAPDGRTIILMSLTDPSRATYDPHGWPGGARTFPVAHQWISEHFHELEDGAVVDVEHILGETAAPKVSEREGFPVP
jgi:hypothetical protein